MASGAPDSRSGFMALDQGDSFSFTASLKRPVYSNMRTDLLSLYLNSPFCAECETDN